MLIHSPGLKHLEMSGVWSFTELVVCLDCGFSRFILPEIALPSIANGTFATNPAAFESSAAGDVDLDNQIAFKW